MSLVGFINSRWGPAAGIALARLLPRKSAEHLAERLAARIAGQHDSPLIQAVRANQAVIRGLPPEDPALEAAVEQVIQGTASSYLSLFRVMRKGHAELRRAATMEPALEAEALAVLREGRGLIFAGTHTAGFDHLLLMLGGMDYPVQVLSYAQPTGSYNAQNRIRLHFGLRLTPIAFGSLRTAIGHLRNGGMVVTAVDRADPAGELLEFCGKPARLPVGHARLAWRTGAPVLVGCPRSEGEDRYQALYGGRLEPDRSKDEMAASRELAQSAIRLMEGFIRRRPQEWHMFHPVWPPAGAA
jgi:KDO2-lipid IV(A) lauroyltransferase